MGTPIDFPAGSPTNPIPGATLQSGLVQVVQNAGAPTVNDDDTANYEVGYLWYDTSGSVWYTCDDNTTGAAVWSLMATPATPVAYSAIAGLLITSLTGAAGTATATIGIGQATATLGSATTQTTVIENAATKSWDVTNGNAINGYEGGATLPNSSTIHMYICEGASGVGSFASTSLTPTFPPGYAVSARRIGSFKTTGAGAPIPFTQIEMAGGGVLNWLTTQTQDINTTSLGATRTLYVLNVPAGIKVQPIVRADGSTAGPVSHYVIFTSGDETDVAPATSGGTVPSRDLDQNVNRAIAFPPILTTDTSGRIGARGNTAGVHLYMVTRGWVDYRRS